MESRPRRLSENRGFTLIELMVVVGVILILASIAIPQFAMYRTRGYNAAATADLKNLRTAMEAYFAGHERYPDLIY